MQKNGSKVVAKTVTASTAVPVKQETAAGKPVVEKKAEKPVEKKAEKPVEEVKQETLVFDSTGVTEEKKETEKKPVKRAVKKTTSRKTTRKTSAKTTEKIEEVYVQYSSQEILTKEVLERAKQAYVAEGHRESSIKSIRLYIKPEEHMAYYVINEKIAGGVPV